ncbi:acyl-protein synthetase [Neptunicella marina]|uniref:Acyl-protein synthetase n=1 Tax=Neptunicella marina TaxID=2125989 RepID=A0A8J6ITA4_9ALTE|nr:acyl-protein synthetase [Neptunicella marina]MBC3765028.1 acyl-protein synthetase [Neptunicella marina]
MLDFNADDIYALDARQKQAFLQPELDKLSEFHREHCDAYQRICSGWNLAAGDSAMPLAVRLFKEMSLKSISDDEVFKVLHSSGTSGQPSTIYLDKATAQLQSQILVKILQHWLGKARRPMLLIDSPATLKKSGGMSARAAGLQGLSFFGHNHTYALDENMQLDINAVSQFFAEFGQQPVLMFGFTFMVWQCFVQQLQKHNLRFNLQDAVLIHGGGWKKLQAQAVSNQDFKQAINLQLGHVRVHDYYGMVEQTGTIYFECEQGHLHCPVWSDIQIRRAHDLSVCDVGETGLIQLNSVTAQSYPGHQLLTEDLGLLLGEDDCQCGRKGKYFNVVGRVPKAEVRGCSDTFS